MKKQKTPKTSFPAISDTDQKNLRRLVTAMRDVCSAYTNDLEEVSRLNLELERATEEFLPGGTSETLWMKESADGN